jgi:hypothetical protein
MALNAQDALNIASRADPPLNISCHGAILLCVGGSLGNFKAGNCRRVSRGDNYKTRLQDERDPFEGSCLAGHTVQIISSWNPSHEMPDFVASVRNILKSSHHVNGLSVEPEKRNIYVVGGLLDMRSDQVRNDAKPFPKELAMLARDWASDLFYRLKKLGEYYHGDIFYLGCGVANDHPKLGSVVHHFNGKLTELVSLHKSRQRAPFPRIVFHDLYTPPFHERWISDPSNKWQEEPESWTSRFMSQYVRYAIQQGVESSNNRYKTPDTAKRSSSGGARGNYKTKPKGVKPSAN